MDRFASFKLVAIVALLTSVIQYSHVRMVQALSSVPAASLRYYTPSAVALKILSLGFDQLLADYYWLTFVQYVGDNELRAKDHYKDAESYIDLVTSLDPKFVKAYFFAAFIIGSERNQPDVAAQIIERGIQANPNNWYLPFIAGINQYLFAHNETTAAKYYRMASKFPDAPDWLSRQADILQAKIPSLIKEVNVWDRIYNSSSDPAVKEPARMKLATLWLKVYKTSPSVEIRNRANDQLHQLGIPDLSRMPRREYRHD